jgi:hypothetical protein
VERDEAERRVKELEKVAEESPGLYQTRVMAFAMLGFGVYGGIILLTVGVLVGMIALVIWHPTLILIKLGWKAFVPVGGGLFGLVKALQMRWEAPAGVSLDERSAPELFRVLAELTERFRVRRLERVILTGDYNAGVSQTPRWGFFGQRNHLTLGLPLLQALSPEDLKSVLAHEFGHLSRNHSRQSAWIYRVVRTYENACQQIGENRLLARFLNWYVPRLETLSFPLRRQNEYEADRGSAEVVGRERAVQALVNVNVRATPHDAFWKEIGQGVRTSERPPANLFRSWPKALEQQTSIDAEQALEAALEEPTTWLDTHPALTDRMRALLGLARDATPPKPAVEPLPERSAAEAYFGASLTALIGSVGDHWCSQVHERWRAQHQEFQQKRQELSALEAQRQARALTADEAFEYADLSEDLLPEQDALPLFRAALELHPEHKATRFSVARLLLARDDESGVPLMKPFTEDDNLALRAASAGHLAAYHARKNDSAALASYLDITRRAQGAQSEREEAQSTLRSTDTFVPHALAPEALAKLCADLELFPELRRVYLARKTFEGEEMPWYVLAFDAKWRPFTSDDVKSSLPHRVLEIVDLSGKISVLAFADNKAFKRPLSRVEGSLILER